MNCTCGKKEPKDLSGNRKILKGFQSTIVNFQVKIAIANSYLIFANRSFVNISMHFGKTMFQGLQNRLQFLAMTSLKEFFYSWK